MFQNKYEIQVKKLIEKWLALDPNVTETNSCFLRVCYINLKDITNAEIILSNYQKLVAKAL